MKNILVTGGMGFIGSNFIRYVLNLNQNIHIINLDALTYAGNPENLMDVQSNYSENYKFIKGNICDFKLIDTIVKKEEIDYVVNFAAESHVDRSIDNPNVFITTNVIGTQSLLDVARKNEIKKYVQISTDEVYGSLGFEDKPFTEENNLLPNSPYSASKASADLLVRAYHKTFGLPVNITRCSNNYGQYQFPEKLIPLMINNALNDIKLPVYGKGINVRDWIHVEDHCSAILNVMLDGKVGEIYNIGGDSEVSNIQIVKQLLSLLDKTESLISFVKDRPGHDLRYAIDHSKITYNLGWNPSITLKEGLKLTVEWYLDNKRWLNNVINKDYLTYYEKHYGRK